MSETAKTVGLIIIAALMGRIFGLVGAGLFITGCLLWTYVDWSVLMGDNKHGTE